MTKFWCLAHHLIYESIDVTCELILRTGFVAAVFMDVPPLPLMLNVYVVEVTQKITATSAHYMFMASTLFTHVILETDMCEKISVHVLQCY